MTWVHSVYSKPGSWLIVRHSRHAYYCFERKHKIWKKTRLPLLLLLNIILDVIDIKVSQKNEIQLKIGKGKIFINYMTICLVIHVSQQKTIRNNKYI